MKTRSKIPCLLPALVAGLGLILAGRVTAQNFTVLHGFNFNDDGSDPIAGLILSGHTLYGTAHDGGTNGNGTVFAVNTDGTGFTNLHCFNYNSDGAYPGAGLILSGDTLYGTASSGGATGNGTVFAINTNGTGFTNLHSFIYSTEGSAPGAGLILSGNTLYGTASSGGTNGYGTVFAINTDGNGFTVLHFFSYSRDGADPGAGLILSGQTLYGTADIGGTNGYGTVFAVNTNGAGFTNLHSFNFSRDGAYLSAGLVLSGNTLYGTASAGGTNGYGTVFAVNTNGAGFTNLHSFNYNSDGANPYGGLILSGDTLYGTANGGGATGDGTVFAVNTDGTGFTNLYSFTATYINSSGDYTNSDGAEPYVGLILSGSTLYGTASGGGVTGNGTVFSLSFPSPQLAITPSGTNVNLTWPSGMAGFSYSGYTLQSTTNLACPAVWTTVSPAPVSGNGLNTVTNAISGEQQFFRLSNP